MFHAKTLATLGLTAAFFLVPALTSNAEAAPHDGRGKGKVVHRDSHNDRHHRRDSHNDRHRDRNSYKRGSAHHDHHSHSSGTRGGIRIDTGKVIFGLIFGDRDKHRHHRGHGHGHHGHHNTVCVQGHYESQWVPPVYRWHRQPCGTRVRVLVRAGYYNRVWIPGKCYTTSSHTCHY